MKGRLVFVLGLAASFLLGAACVFCCVAHGTWGGPVAPQESCFPVSIFGARGDGKTDDTAAFQKALDAAAAGGGTVVAGRGNFYFAGHLEVPSGVTLEGLWHAPPSHTGLRDGKSFARPTDNGTTFLVTEHAGQESATPFITLRQNSTLKGVVIYYPNQKADAIPRPYPWTIAMRGNNPAVLDVELLNPYNGIDASQNSRHMIRNVCGQPLRRGIWVDGVYDIGRIENVHFNPWWSMQPGLYEWQMANGEAFAFGRSDWQYVHNTFCFGYHAGYRFVATTNGVCNGNFLGIGADDCQTSVVVEDAAKFAVLVSNGEFTAFHGPDPTMVDVRSTNSGAVRFVNCAFWGPCHQIARIAGSGTVGFGDCTFAEWDSHNEGRHAIQANGGNVLVRGCEFVQPKPQVELGEQVRRAVIAENIMAGPLTISNHGKGVIEVSANASDRAMQ